MTKQEFDKIIARYEEHKRELNYQYKLGKLHGVLEALRIQAKHDYPCRQLKEYVEKLIRDINK